jgi:hypothetical protein
MAVVKEGLQVHEVIIQEGVHTFETVEDGVAEPVVYMMDHYVVGGFYRVHTERGRDENLNAPGMHFKPLAFDTSGTMPDAAQGPDAPPNRFYAYGVVARLALLAASVEIEETAPARTRTRWPHDFVWPRKIPRGSEGDAANRSHAKGSRLPASSSTRSTRSRPTRTRALAMMRPRASMEPASHDPQAQALFILDPLEGLKAYKDSSIAMMRPPPARSRGVGAAARRPHLARGRGDRHRLRGARGRRRRRGLVSRGEARPPAAAVLMRQDPPFDFEYVTATWLLERAEAEGARIFNHPRAIARSLRKARHHRVPAVHRRHAGRARSDRHPCLHRRTATPSSSRSTAWAAARSSACAPTTRTATSSSKR